MFVWLFKFLSIKFCTSEIYLSDIGITTITAVCIKTSKNASSHIDPLLLLLFIPYSLLHIVQMCAFFQRGYYSKISTIWALNSGVHLSHWNKLYGVLRLNVGSKNTRICQANTTSPFHIILNKKKSFSKYGRNKN